MANLKSFFRFTTSSGKRFSTEPTNDRDELIVLKDKLESELLADGHKIVEVTLKSSLF